MSSRRHHRASGNSWNDPEISDQPDPQQDGTLCRYLSSEADLDDSRHVPSQKLTYSFWTSLENGTPEDSKPLKLTPKHQIRLVSARLAPRRRLPRTEKPKIRRSATRKRSVPHRQRYGIDRDMEIPSLETGERIMTIPRGIDPFPCSAEATIDPTPRPRHTFERLLAKVVSNEIIG